MTVNLSALAGAGQQFFDNNGDPLSGGKLYSYEAGTTTPQITYTTAAGNVAHSNPIILDSAGRVPSGQIWLTAGLNYKFVLKTSTEVQIATWDNITGINGTGIASNAINVEYDPAGLGAVPTTVQAKLRETVSVKDFGAVGDGVTDDTAAIQAAINYAATVGAAVTLSGAEYLCNAQLLLQTGSTILGPGKLIAGPISGFPLDRHMGFLYGLVKSNITVKDVEFDLSAWTVIPVAIFSVSSILCRRGTYFRIEGCTFNTTGGGPGFIGCKDIIVTNNTVIAATPGTSPSGFNDGLINVWVEFDIDAERCIISNNTIKANGYGLWGIMVTGLTFQTQIMECKSFVVSGNIVEDTFYDGIWVFGRNAVLDGITITGNVIKNVRQGISISDATNFAIVGNAISNATQYGIYLWSETSAGGTVGATGGVVSNNVLKDVASSLSGQPPAIYVDNNSSRNTITGNTIVGSTHYNGILINSNAVENLVSSNNVQAGRSANFVYLNTQTKSDGASYTPTLTSVSNVAASAFQAATFYTTSNRVTVYFRLTVQPTTAGNFTQLRISLPYATDVALYSLFGVASQTTGESAYVADDATNNAAILTFTPATNSNRTIFGSFVYRIITP
jgi:hypothetical protein